MTRAIFIPVRQALPAPREGIFISRDLAYYHICASELFPRAR